jgi:hypothetical protein
VFECRGRDSGPGPSAYETDELPLLYRATKGAADLSAGRPPKARAMRADEGITSRSCSRRGRGLSGGHGDLSFSFSLLDLDCGVGLGDLDLLADAGEDVGRTCWTCQEVSLHESAVVFAHGQKVPDGPAQVSHAQAVQPK